MIRMLQYASKENYIIIHDGNGDEIDPTSVFWIKVFVYKGFSAIAKFFYSYTEDTPVGFTEATLVDSSVPTNAISCIINSSVSGDADPGQYTIQIDWAETDARFEDNIRIYGNKGDYLIIEQAMI